MGETLQLAGFSAGLRLENCPPQVILQAKRCVLETLGCALGGSKTILAQTAARAVERLGGGGPATVIGFGRRAAVDHAAFVNGISANAHDYDGGVVLQGHQGGTAVATALAMAELTGTSGRRFLEAVIAAYEVVIRIADAIYPSAERRKLVSGYGPHQGFAAVVAAGRILGLDAERMSHALGICAAFSPVASGVKGNWQERPRSWTKDLVAWPSAVGINAALLAEEGFLGPRDILEGDVGFWRMAGSDSFDPKALVDGLGERFHIMRVYFKPYPACRFLHPAIEALREILARRNWSAAQVAAVQVGVPRFLIDGHFGDLTMFNMVDAEFTMPYSLALILQGEEPGPHWYDPPLFQSPAVRQAMEKVVLRPDEEMQRLYVEKRAVGSVVRVVGEDGSVETARVEEARGSPERPMEDSELEGKYRRLAAAAISAPAAERLLEMVNHLEEVERAADMGELLAS